MVKKLKQIVNKKNSIAGASIILIITLFLSNVLGVFRDHFLTQKIPTDLLSVYYAAFRLPDLIFNLLILGAISSAFIPVFTNLLARNKNEEAWQVAQSVVNIAVIFLGLAIILLFIFMPWLMYLVVPGFEETKRTMAVDLARIMLLSPLFFGLSYILGGILNSYKRFFVYAIAPLVYNITIIVGTLFFADKYSVYGIAVAVVIGAFLHFFIQLPIAIKLGFKLKFKIFWQHWGVRRIGVLMLPRAIALGGNQVLLLVFTAIASSIGGYGIAVYNLADNIQTMPMVVFGTSFATAIFPTLSEYYSQNKFTDFATNILKVTRTILFFMLPMIIILILLRAEIVRLILGSGYFGWQQTKDTADTLAYFSLSLVATGLAPLFNRAFYAMHNTRIPMAVSLIGVVLSIAFGKILYLKIGVPGLALGYTIGNVITTVLLYFFLQKRVEIKLNKEFIFFIIKIIVASLFMAIAVQEIKYIIGTFVDMQRFWGVAVKALAAIAGGGLIYFISCWVFSCEEMSAVKQILNRYKR